MPAVKTTCPYCGVGCGLEVSVLDNGEVSVRGDKSHPANYGRLCSKGAALGTTLDLSSRLLKPVVSGEPSDWDNALDLVADTFKQTIDEHGPDSVAFYVSGQLLTEDYYVANKLMKGFIGSGNIDTNSRLCMSSSVAGHKRAFGSDTVPGCYEDWEQCELMVLTGSNTAWCHPVLYQRLVKARKANPDMKVVVIDPRRTATCDVADLHLAVNPGSDAFLFTGLLNWLYQQGCADDGFTQFHTVGLSELLDIAQRDTYSIENVSKTCGVEVSEVERFYGWFEKTEKAITVYSQGINQSTSGSDKVNAIINCHLLTGRLGKPGMGPFSVTGQPNAMGGREVGALSNQLAAHMDYENPHDVDRVARFWSASNMSQQPGLKAVDLFKAVRQGKIKALWIMATNPMVSMPETGLVKEALQQCEFLVVSDCEQNTDTTQQAHVLLPALAWGEKSGTVTNSERCISRQRAFLQTPGEARADWWILSRVARRMGYAGFDYGHPAEIFSEHAALSGFENGGSRDFDLSGLEKLDADEYDKLEPLQWPVTAKGQTTARLFSDGRFFSQNGKARFVAVDPRLPEHANAEAYPLVLNTGRVRDQWHTMTRTGKSPRLNDHVSEPFVQINPGDAERLGIQQDQLVKVSSEFGNTVVRSAVSREQKPGSVFVPMHWSTQNVSFGGIGQVVNAKCDSLSGQPEFKHTPVSINPVKPLWYGFILSRQPVDIDRDKYWVKIKKKGGWFYELAGMAEVNNWSAYVRDTLSHNDAGEWSELLDSTGNSFRAAQFFNNRLQRCIFISRDFSLPSSEWLMSLFESKEISRSERLQILSAKPKDEQSNEGKVICSCFNVGKNRINEAIKKFCLKTPEQVGDKLQAGTNCGSCIPEINALLKSVEG